MVQEGSNNIEHALRKFLIACLVRWTGCYNAAHLMNDFGYVVARSGKKTDTTSAELLGNSFITKGSYTCSVSSQ